MTIQELKYLERSIKSDMMLKERVGKLKKNKDGNYKKAIIYKELGSLYGTRVYGEGSTIEECARKITERYLKISEENYSKTKPKSFAEVADEWYKIDIEASKIAQKSKENYKRNLEKYINPYFSETAIQNLKEKDYQAYINTFAGEGQRKIEQIILTLTRVIEFAYKNEYTRRHNFRIKMPDFIPIQIRDRLPDNVLSLLYRLYRQGDKQAEDYIIMLMTGMRPCEAVNVLYTDINYKKGYIDIKASKTDNGIRKIPLPNFILEIIKKRYDEVKETVENPKYLFTKINDLSKQQTVEGLTHRFNAVLRKLDILNGATVRRNQIIETTLGGVNTKDKKRSGLKYPYTTYCLRHTYATLLDKFEIKDSTIKMVMGHSLKSDITHSVYIHKEIETIKRELEPFFKDMEEKITVESNIK